MKIDLSGRVAVVTGAAGELGRVMARTLAECGANVAIGYLKSQDKALALRDELRGKGARATAIQVDVGCEESVYAMRDAVTAELGEAGIIVNNAVAAYDWTTLLKQDVKDFEGQFRTCVMQNVLMAKAFVPGMIRAGWGRVIAISTECAISAAAGTGAYVSGKRGMDGVLRVLAKEVGEHNITVNQVAPGWMISDRVRASGTERNEAYEKAVPLRHRGQDQDIANAVAFLASDLAGFISGAFLPVCGGNVMVGV
ncbi:MAG: SDR family oxidoreductase [Planctomycetota bacterium]|nr:SDR family oxidoreductase [Planctomycetota bacterium]